MAVKCGGYAALSCHTPCSVCGAAFHLTMV